jgi:hypothetical protein
MDGRQVPNVSRSSNDDRMAALRDIDAVFKNESSGLREEVGRSVADFTVALFSVSKSREGDLLKLGGTGTLVVVANSHYILTAAHVWEEVLKSSVKIGITLKEGLNHRFLIETCTIAAFGLPKPNMWGEWGPDLMFLRIPPEHVHAISTYRVFYNLTIERQTTPADCLERHVLMGTPETLAESTRTYAEVQIHGMFLDISGAHTHGDFDYLDLNVDVSLPSPGIAQDFRGVSGGGLWEIVLFRSALTNKIDWHSTLEGVAFHQSELVSGHRIIRCHGKRSILAAMPNKTPSK